MNRSLYSFVKNSISNPDLILILSVRMLKSRYRKSILGVFWSLLNPLLTTLVLWFIFVQVFAGKFSIQTSYGAYVLSGILFTNLVQGTIPLIGDSITATGSLASKVKSNPLVFVYASTLSGVFNFALGLVPLLLISVIKGTLPGFEIFLVLPFIILTFLFVSSTGILVAIMYSKYNDTQNIVSVLLMITSYVTPIFYPISVLHGRVRSLITWNPLTILLDSYRSCTIGFASVTRWQLGTLCLLVPLYALMSYKLLQVKWPVMVSRI
jgi:ABC-2 type transport system permease protein